MNFNQLHKKGFLYDIVKTGKILGRWGLRTCGGTLYTIFQLSCHIATLSSTCYVCINRQTLLLAWHIEASLCSWWLSMLDTCLLKALIIKNVWVVCPKRDIYLIYWSHREGGWKNLRVQRWGENLGNTVFWAWHSQCRHDHIETKAAWNGHRSDWVSGLSSETG